MDIPPEYVDREQTYLKHRVLDEYLTLWGHKLGSVARSGEPVELWYVDCFSGPWEARDEELRDTSIHIGLDALERAAVTWGRRGYSIRPSAIFVERDRAAFQQLKSFLDRRSGRVQTHPFRGEFGEHVESIRTLIGSAAAFVFVDPKGWKGAEMKHIAALTGQRWRDVLVNVMFNHVNRFKDDPRRFLREQMGEFFGLEPGALPPGLSEDELLARYREQLKQHCKLAYAADLAVRHPTIDRTWYRLVVGGNSPSVLDVFRDVERKVIGGEAGAVREAARKRQRVKKTGQVELELPLLAADLPYEELRQRGLAALPVDVIGRVRSGGPKRFADLWPALLEIHHVRWQDVADCIWRLFKQREIALEGVQSGQRSVRDEHIVRAVER